MAKRGKKTSQVEFISRDKVAQAVFAAAESMGISDRKLLERFTEQVSQRLEVAQPLPGMEGFVSLQDSGNSQRNPNCKRIFSPSQ